MNIIVDEKLTQELEAYGTGTCPSCQTMSLYVSSEFIADVTEIRQSQGQYGDIIMKNCECYTCLEKYVVASNTGIDALDDAKYTIRKK